jgi:hypothetical protein
MRAFWVLPLLGACGRSPEGTWTGEAELIATDGIRYANSLTPSDDGTGEATLYALLESTDQDGDPVYLITQSMFDVVWKLGDDVSFGFRCKSDPCVYSPAMDCVYTDDDAMTCDMIPDFYADDEEILQWTRE